MNDHTFTVRNRYLVIPVNMNAKRKNIRMTDGDSLVFDFDARTDPDDPQFFSYINIERFSGRTLTLSSEPVTDLNFGFADSLPEDNVYNRPYRPSVHFTAGRGWINDPNGLTFYDGTYHMFFQHNPACSEWGNMTWGHAVSRDLVHWRELDCALYPDDKGTMFSGSGIIDEHMLTPFSGETGIPAMLLYYTAAGNSSMLSRDRKFTQCLAFSTDGGKTFTKYTGNPVIPHITGGNRDPKAVWCEGSGCYLLALYLDGNEYAMFRSEDLINWTEQQRITLPEDGECPDLYPVRVENSEGEHRWVFTGASDRYMVGDIVNDNGIRFVPVQDARPYRYGTRSSYAAQSFSGTGDRRIRVCWDVFHSPDPVFENQMGIPCEMTLVKTDDGYRLRSLPVEEFTSLRTESVSYNADGNRLVIPLRRNAYDIELRVPENAPDLVMDFFGYRFTVRPAENSFTDDDSCLPLRCSGRGDIRIRIISDTLGCEIFTDDGLIYAVSGTPADYTVRYLTLKSEGSLRGTELTLHALANIWQDKE